MKTSSQSSGSSWWRAALRPALIRSLVWGAVAGGLAALVRYRLIQLDYFRNTCDVDVMPSWCWPRYVIIWSFNNYVFAIVSVALGVWALLQPFRRSVALGAVVFGAVGLVLYNAEPASLGLVLGLIALARD